MARIDGFKYPCSCFVRAKDRRWITFMDTLSRAAAALVLAASAAVSSCTDPAQDYLASAQPSGPQTPDASEPSRPPDAKHLRRRLTKSEEAWRKDLSTFVYREHRCPKYLKEMEALDRPPPPREQSPHLLAAMRAGEWDRVRILFHMGAAIPPGLTPSERGRLERESLSVDLVDAARRGDVHGIRDLVRRGADPNVAIPIDDAATPLAWAAACNQTDSIRTLIALGAQVDRPFLTSRGRAISYGNTALGYAAHFGSTDAMRLLIAEGADVNARNRNVSLEGEPLGRGRILEGAGTSAARAVLEAAGARQGR